jgi:hypothetical protein
LRLLLDGRAPAERLLTLGEKERVPVHLGLQAAQRLVEVRSVPSGAQVFLDGQPVVGKTPLSLSIDGDDFHALRVEKDGFAPATRNLTPDDAAEQIELRLKPETAPFAALWIDADRTARVFLDGGDTGFLTPTVQLRVPAGPHTIELRDYDGTIGAVARIRLAQGQVQHLTLDWARPR